MEAIEKENPEQLRGVLPKNYAQANVSPYVLGELINLFSKITFELAEDKAKDILGRVYEYFIGKFAEAEGKRGGEFYTPRCVVKLLVEILRKLLSERIKVRIRSNPLRFSSFREKLERTTRAYHSRAITSAQVMEELIKIAKGIRTSEEQGKALGLTDEELAFYDALARGEECIMYDEQLSKLAKKLVHTIRRNLSINWIKHESVKAKVRAAVKRTLRIYGISPIEYPETIDLVMKQAQALYKDWPTLGFEFKDYAFRDIGFSNQFIVG